MAPGVLDNDQSLLPTHSPAATATKTTSSLLGMQSPPEKPFRSPGVAGIVAHELSASLHTPQTDGHSTEIGGYRRSRGEREASAAGGGGAAEPSSSASASRGSHSKSHRKSKGRRKTPGKKTDEAAMAEAPIPQNPQAVGLAKRLGSRWKKANDEPMPANPAAQAAMMQPALSPKERKRARKDGLMARSILSAPIEVLVTERRDELADHILANKVDREYFQQRLMLRTINKFWAVAVSSSLSLALLIFAIVWLRGSEPDCVAAIGAGAGDLGAGSTRTVDLRLGSYELMTNLDADSYVCQYFAAPFGSAADTQRTTITQIEARMRPSSFLERTCPGKTCVGRVNMFRYPVGVDPSALGTTADAKAWQCPEVPGGASAQPVWSWASSGGPFGKPKGEPAFRMPPGVGLPVANALGWGAGGYVLQVHFSLGEANMDKKVWNLYNPTDDSGVSVTLSTDPRLVEADVLSLGSTKIAIPVAEDSTVTSATTFSTESRLLKGSATLISMLPQARAMATSVSTAIERGGKVVHEMGVPKYVYGQVGVKGLYNSDTGTYPQLKPGDTLRTICHYDTCRRDATTKVCSNAKRAAFGYKLLGKTPKTVDVEMCFAHVVYYPAKYVRFAFHVEQ